MDRCEASADSSAPAKFRVEGRCLRATAKFALATIKEVLQNAEPAFLGQE